MQAVKTTIDSLSSDEEGVYRLAVRVENTTPQQRDAIEKMLREDEHISSFQTEEQFPHWKFTVNVRASSEPNARQFILRAMNHPDVRNAKKRGGKKRSK